MPEIAFIMGKSASGKDKIYKNLVSDKELGLKTITLYTTRPKRVGEEEGVEYHFVDDLQADQIKEDGKLIEMRCYETVYGIWRYFTVDDGQVDLSNKSRYLVIGTLEAYEQFCAYFGKKHILPIYIEVDDGIRLQRALDREKKQEKPRYDEMCRRFLADSHDFSEDNIKRLGITKRYYNNEVLEDCITEVKNEILKQM